MNRWQEGTIELKQTNGEKKVARYWVVAFDEKSEYGIDGGRISKLSIKLDGNWVVNYDRGFDVRPSQKDKDVMKAYRYCLKKYN